jgi:hypothetical protein
MKSFRVFSIAQILLASLVFIQTASAQVASNPPYAIEQSVIANGGGSSSSLSGSVFKVEGAIGQSIAAQASNSPFTITSGFWTAPAFFAPTAALVTVGGRVMTASGRGIRNVAVKLTGASGATRVAYTTAFGYYRFANVAAGETYIFSLSSKRFAFNEIVRVVEINQDASDINFTAND